MFQTECKEELQANTLSKDLRKDSEKEKLVKKIKAVLEVEAASRRKSREERMEKLKIFKTQTAEMKSWKSMLGNMIEHVKRQKETLREKTMVSQELVQTQLALLKQNELYAEIIENNRRELMKTRNMTTVESCAGTDLKEKKSDQTQKRPSSKRLYCFDPLGPEAKLSANNRGLMK